MRRERTESEIIRIWMERPIDRRLQIHTESFGYDETWNAELKLHRNRNLHYQKVMNLIRILTTD